MIGGNMTGVQQGEVKSIALAIAAATEIILATAPAQAASVKEIFAKYNLFGSFAQDCHSPPNNNPQNWWFINRAIDADHVQRDFMSGPTTRGFMIMIDKATELKPNEIRVT